MSSTSPLLEIIAKLKGNPKENNESYKVTLSHVFTLTNSLEKIVVSLVDFKLFVSSAHNLMIMGDSSKRSSLLRATRLSMQNEQFVRAILDAELHWIVISSLERDYDYSMERMQAFKLMEKVRIIAPTLYPVAFGRSLVAVANSKDDNFRKLCLEALRELAIANPGVVAAVGGFGSLLEAVIEPMTQEMADNIMLTILFLLNDPQTRRVVKPHVDLRVLLAPLTDVDSDPGELAPRWKAARAAVLLMMRSWVGVVLLTSEDMGLPTLVRMLQDPKVPAATQDVILETITDIFAPVVSKTKAINKNRQQQQAWSSQAAAQQQQAATPIKLTQHSSSSNLLAMSGSQGGNGSTGASNPLSNDSLKLLRSNSGSHLVKQNSGASIGTVGTGASQANTPTGRSSGPPPVSGNPQAGRASHRGSFSFSDNIFASLTHQSGSHGSSGSLSSMAASNVPSTQSVAATGGGGNRGGFIASFFNSGNRNSTTSPGTTRGSVSAVSGMGRRGSYDASSTTQAAVASKKLASIPAGNIEFQRSGDASRLSAARKESIDAAKQRLAATVAAEGIFDPIFNLMDNYTALICCSFLHCNLIHCLFSLGSRGSVALATKSRLLMVSYLRTLANIFPESKCSELLTIPSLIEFAAASSTNTSRAHKASQILIALADAFSLMPFKQVSGSHVSGLSAVTSLNARQRAGSAPVPRINGSISGGVGGAYSSVSASGASGTPGSGTSRSNFVSLNIQTVYELAEEIRISSFSNISSYGAGSGRGNGPSNGADGSADGNGSTLDVIRTLRSNLTPAIDKMDFTRQMDASRVVGKEGKEPFRWDWVTISDMLEYSFSYQSERLGEALKTKWVRRVSGFYRCSVEEKGYFANLDWEPTNLQYLECACNMYSVLLKDEAGMAFLNSDRRGMLFTEIANEIQQLANSASTGTTSRNSIVGNSPVNIPTKNVFRLYSCTCTMAREFFTLLGRIIRTAEARHLLDSTNIFQHLSKLGTISSLDYVSRLALTSLSFTDGGFMSRHLMQLWTTQTSCSNELRVYFHSLLRVLLRNPSADKSCGWCVDAIVNQLTASDDTNTDVLYKALEEAVQNKNHLRSIIAKRPRILTELQAESLLVRFLSVPEGIEYLSQRGGHLEETLAAWQGSRCAEYVFQVEEKISLAFHLFSGKHRPEALKLLQPIPIETPEFVAAINARRSFYAGSGNGNAATPAGGGSTTTLGTSKTAFGSMSNMSAQTSADTAACEEGEDDSANLSGMERDPNSDLMVDLHGLMRVPWNIEVRMTSAAGYQGGASSGQAATVTSSSSNTGSMEYLKVDSFLDTTDLTSPLCYETTCDNFRYIKVRGIVLDSRGAPVGQPVAHNKVISSTLLAGICSVSRQGKVQYNTENRPARRKSSVTSGRDSVTVGVSRQSMSMAAAAQIAADIAADSDTPVTVQQDYLYDWSSCKPGHRQGNVVELGDSRFSVTVPGEPVIWIFSRRAPGLATSSAAASARSARSGSMAQMNVTAETFFSSNNSSRSDHSRSGNLLYLVEVQYYFRLETGNAMFVPMPRHAYGELARTSEGLAILNQRSIISDLLNVVHRRVSDSVGAATGASSSSIDMRSALWSLAHIGSTELGHVAILSADPMFLEWCLENIASCPNFSLRGTFFYVVGLLSRTARGSRKLSQCQWDCAPAGSNSAVAFPRNPSLLFKPLAPASAAPTTTAATAILSTTPGSVSFDDSINNTSSTSSSAGQSQFSTSPPKIVKSLTPFLQSGTVSLEIEVLNLIAKLPGVIVYRECKTRLDHIRKEHPEVFCRRSLYVNVHRILECYTFKLSARRDVLALFSPEARLREVIPPGQ